MHWNAISHGQEKDWESILLLLLLSYSSVTINLPLFSSLLSSLPVHVLLRSTIVITNHLTFFRIKITWSYFFSSSPLFSSLLSPLSPYFLRIGEDTVTRHSLMQLHASASSLDFTGTFTLARAEHKLALSFCAKGDNELFYLSPGGAFFLPLSLRLAGQDKWTWKAREAWK